jgi:uncharacterized membrane protein YoaK (UPF0700 family)
MKPASAAPAARVMTGVAVVLTFASGASDVASFTRLGNVFTSVMTGNITLFGLSVARGSGSLAAHTTVAVAGYVAGVVVGTRILWRRSGGPVAKAPVAKAPVAKAPDGEWPPRMTLTLLTELTLLAGVLTGWELTGTRPSGAAQFVILTAAACAMGIQSAAVNQMGLGNVSTTFLTGTLTGLVSAIARPGGKPGSRRAGVLAGLVAGALLAGGLDATAPAAVPLVPLLGVATALTLGSGLYRPAWLEPREPTDPEAPTAPADPKPAADSTASSDPAGPADPTSPGSPRHEP